jgi:hypothetical protein
MVIKMKTFKKQKKNIIFNIFFKFQKMIKWIKFNYQIIILTFIWLVDLFIFSLVGALLGRLVFEILK